MPYRRPDARHQITCDCGRTFTHRGTHAAHLPKCLGAEPTVEALYRIGQVQPDGECLLWGGRAVVGGYGGMPATAAEQVGEQLAHRAVFVIAHGPTEQYVLHSCDRPACVRIEHLRSGTARENAADMMARGRWFPFGRAGGR